MTDLLFQPSFHRYLIAGVFILAGILHFLKTDMYVKIMPSYIPKPRAMVYISGVAEVIGGLAIIFPETRVAASIGLMALLLAIFPANIDMAVKAYRNYGLTWYSWLLMLRLPLQFVLIYWVYWAGIIY